MCDLAVCFGRVFLAICSLAAEPEASTRLAPVSASGLRCQIDCILSFTTPICPFIARHLPLDPLLAILKKRVTSSVIPITYDEPFIVSYPLLMAILKAVPRVGATHVYDMRYGDSTFALDLGLLAILELSSQSVRVH